MALQVESFYGFQQTFSVDHTQDIDVIVADFIYQSIAVDESFSHTRIIQFRHNATGFWLLRQSITQIKKVFYNGLCIVKRIPADVFSNAVNIIQGLLRLYYGLSHRLKRSLASSVV